MSNTAALGHPRCVLGDGLGEGLSPVGERFHESDVRGGARFSVGNDAAGKGAMR